MATELDSTDQLTKVFEAHRDLLTAVAYRMLGRVVDAEDIVQETWLRWTAEDRGEVRRPRAYLVRITTRLALDRLRQAQTRQESYVGPWLPEPLISELSTGRDDTAERALSAESVSMAMLVVLESLSPLERVVFVLREAFGFPYAEIAQTLERGEAAVRQLATRARRHVDARTPRYDVDPDMRRDLTERFLAAATGGDLQRLLALLAPDISLVGDSGGKAKAPRRVIETADKVGRFLNGVATKIDSRSEVRIVAFNGAPAVVLTVDGQVTHAVQLEVTDGLIQRVYLWANPDKVGPLTDQLHRGS